MTMRLPRLRMVDQFLKLIGKRRGIVVPKGVGHDCYAQLRWENFWTVLFRSADAPYPDGVIDPKVIQEKFEDKLNG